MLNKSNSLILLALISITSSFPMSQAAAPIDWDKRLAKANQQMSIGEVDQAMGMFSAEVKKHPEAGAPHVALGRALKKKGKMSDAKSEFTRSTEVDPGYADAFYELGAMQENDKEWQAAVSSFEQYLQLAPDADRAKSVSERLRNCKEKLE